MQTFAMLTRLAPVSLHSPSRLEALEQRVKEAIKVHCKEVEWLASYAVTGPYDYLDLFRAPDAESALRVSTLVRTFGYANTEVWTATEWKRFKEIVHRLPDQD